MIPLTREQREDLRALLSKADLSVKFAAERLDEINRLIGYDHELKQLAGHLDNWQSRFRDSIDKLLTVDWSECETAKK